MSESSGIKQARAQRRAEATALLGGEAWGAIWDILQAVIMATHARGDADVSDFRWALLFCVSEARHCNQEKRARLIELMMDDLAWLEQQKPEKQSGNFPAPSIGGGALN